MRSEAQKRADARRAEKLVSFTVHINRDVKPEAADKLECLKKSEQFRRKFIRWIMYNNFEMNGE